MFSFVSNSRYVMKQHNFHCFSRSNFASQKPTIRVGVRSLVSRPAGGFKLRETVDCLQGILWMESVEVVWTTSTEVMETNLTKQNQAKH
jgi:hypothetical protein